MAVKRTNLKNENNLYIVASNPSRHVKKIEKERQPQKEAENLKGLQSQNPPKEDKKK